MESITTIIATTPVSTIPDFQLCSELCYAVFNVIGILHSNSWMGCYEGEIDENLQIKLKLLIYPSEYT